MITPQKPIKQHIPISSKSNLDKGANKQWIFHEESKFVKVPAEAEMDEKLWETWEEASLEGVLESANKMIQQEYNNM